MLLTRLLNTEEVVRTKFQACESIGRYAIKPLLGGNSSKAIPRDSRDKLANIGHV